jgi:poly(A) polymerase
MKMKVLPKTLLRHPAIAVLLELAASRGVRVYLVGGAVRDLVRGKPIRDIDVVVTGMPYEELGNLLAERGTTSMAGKFGTIKFVPKEGHRAIDIALPRTERSETPGTRTGFAVHMDHALPIEEDLGRRDFTVNAMAIDLTTRTLLDPFHGQKDLAARMLRTVGDPKRRFAEDTTRILRGLRFACDLGMEIAPETLREMRAAAHRILSDVPKEMIAQELTKALIGNPVRFLEFLEETRIGTLLLPELMALRTVAQDTARDGAKDALAHTAHALAVSQSKEFAQRFGAPETDPSVLLAVLFHDLGKAEVRATRTIRGKTLAQFNGHGEKGAAIAARIWNRLKFDQTGAHRETVLFAVSHHADVTRAKTSEMRPETLDAYFLAEPERGTTLLKLLYCEEKTKPAPARVAFPALVRRIEELRTRVYAHGKPKTLMTGEELMAEFHMQPGVEVGKALKKLRALQLAGELSTPAQARAYLKQQKEYAHAHSV